MSALLFGPAGGLPAGYARCLAGTTLLRGHTPGRVPDWFGPRVGGAGVGRFDLPMRAAATDPGVCYLAPALAGVLLERVIRDVSRPVLSLATMLREHAVTSVTLNRDLVLVDLLSTPWTVHGVQMSEITGPPPYRATQQIAARLAMVPYSTSGGASALPDGIAYGSRFGAAHECIALWDRAASALTWGHAVRLGDDRAALASACMQLGIGLIK